MVMVRRFTAAGSEEPVQAREARSKLLADWLRRTAEKRCHRRTGRPLSWNSRRKYSGFVIERFLARPSVRHNKCKCAVSRPHKSAQNDARKNSLCETTSGSAPLILALTKAPNAKIVKIELFTVFAPSFRAKGRCNSSLAPEDHRYSTIMFSKHDRFFNEEQLLTYWRILYSLILCKLRV